MNAYVLDHGWQKERDRLAGIESLFDGYSTQRLAALGVSEGWHCLEVGFGAGGVALWLAEQVGATGRVVAVDLDPRSLPDTTGPTWRSPARHPDRPAGGRRLRSGTRACCPGTHP